MRFFQRAASWLVIGMNVLLLFILLFQERVQFPTWLQSLGRVHPLFLHIPIGAVIIAVILLIVRKQIDDVTYRTLMTFMLAFIAVTAALTALMGIVLGAEGGYSPEAIEPHRTAGVVMSLVAWVVMVLCNTSLPSIYFKAGLLVMFVTLLVAGHLGSVITHGEDYVFEPFVSKDRSSTIADSTTFFRAAIFPIIDKKCVSCHNEKKKKGDLILSTASGRARGGENGVIWVAGSPSHSSILTKVLLPESHEDHMPPQGKPQLSPFEVQLMYQWILSGADSTVRWSEIPEQDTLMKLARLALGSGEREHTQQYHFSEVSNETISGLNDPYRSVTRVAVGEPALAASFYIKTSYTTERLRELLKVREQLVHLNLSGMPIEDQDCEVIRLFENLEKLNLNFTLLSEAGLKRLAGLQELKSLAVAGTQLDEKALEDLHNFKSLEEVYIWHSNVIESAALEKILKGVVVNAGFVADPREILRLTPPLLTDEKFVFTAEEKLTISHKLPGTVIHFTVDGTEPDSVGSQVYTQPYAVDQFTILKSIACKTGWYCSGPARYAIFPKGVAPKSSRLINVPNKDFRGEGAATLTDNKKGPADYHRDMAWLGYREQPLEAVFTFDQGVALKSVVISYDRNTGAFLFPPEKVEIFAGDTESDMKLVRTIEPTQPLKYGPAEIDAVNLTLDGTPRKVIRLVVHPLRKLPSWHQASKNKDVKDKRGWVFVDEVFFYQ